MAVAGAPAPPAKPAWRRRPHVVARAGTRAPAKAVAAARRKGSLPGQALRPTQPRRAAPGLARAPPPLGAPVRATVARGLRAAPAAPRWLQGAGRRRAPADGALAGARDPAGPAAAIPRVWRPAKASWAHVPAPSRVGERVPSSLRRAQAPGQLPAVAPPFLARGLPARDPVPAAPGRARRARARSADLPALGRHVRPARSGLDAAAPRTPPARG